MKALLIPAFGPVKEVQQNGLDDLQRLVDGHIEALPADGREDANAYVNETGLLAGLPGNARATLLLGFRIAGAAVLCGFDAATGASRQPSLRTSPGQCTPRTRARTRPRTDGAR